MLLGRISQKIRTLFFLFQKRNAAKKSNGMRVPLFKLKCPFFILMCRLEVFNRRAGYCCGKRCPMSQWKRNNQNTRFWEVIPAKTLVDKWLDSAVVFLLKVVFSHVKCLNRLAHNKEFGRFHTSQLVYKGFDALAIHSFFILPTGACWGFWYDEGEWWFQGHCWHESLHMQPRLGPCRVCAQFLESSSS